MAKRDYDNSLREQRAQQTRGRILDATVSELAKRDGEISIRLVAERAGVSQPTVYRYYPNRTALMEAVHGWVEESLGFPPRPQDTDEAIGSPPDLWAWFDDHSDKILASGHLDPEFQDSLNRRRTATLQRVFGNEVSHLGSEEQAAIMMLLGLVMGGTAWRQARADGISSDVAAKRASWLLRIARY